MESTQTYGMVLALRAAPTMKHPDSKLVVLSNRGPYRCEDGQWVRSSGGLVTALTPVLEEHGGVWVSAAEGECGPPPQDAGYQQVMVQLDREVHDGYYAGLANAVLWPTLHGFARLAEIGDAPWYHYNAANRAFVDAALGVATDADLVWVHDYHLLVAPRMMRERLPRARIGWFNHIPWPDADHFAVLPWREEIVHGLLGANVLGFHTAAYANHFLECARRFSDASVNAERGLIQTETNETRLIVAPIGIPTSAIAERVRSEPVLTAEANLRKALGNRRIILGVDRLDYTKGIPERFAAYARLLEQKPELLDEVVLVQIVVPSREDVTAYANLREEIDRLVGNLNGSFSKTGRVAVHYHYGTLEPEQLYAHYRAADVALVTPLRDGMNLVAQEYVASRSRDDGALVLSEFAGAAERLDQAYLVNPHDVDRVAEQLDRALHAPLEERRARMAALRATVKSLDVDVWAQRFLAQLRSVVPAGSPKQQCGSNANALPKSAPHGVVNR